MGTVDSGMVRKAGRVCDRALTSDERYPQLLSHTLMACSCKSHEWHTESLCDSNGGTGQDRVAREDAVQRTMGLQLGHLDH